jgi:ankyrin repeat protein
MPLADFPPELLLEIATHLDTAGRNALACTNRGLHNLLNEGLYFWDLTQTQDLGRSLIWGVEKGVEGTIQWAVHAAQKFNLIPINFGIALSMAVCEGHVPIVELLLKVHGINLNSWRDGYTCTPLIEACRGGYLKIINLLLAEDSVDINLTIAKTTPFMEAARMGLVEVVESLLARENFDPNIVTDSGEYALGDAAFRGDVDVMKLLLDRPDVDLNLARRLDCTTPLILGALFPDVVKLLLDQQGIDVNYQKNSINPSTCCSFCTDAKYQKNSVGLGTALVRTAHYQCVKSAKLLLEREDIKVNISDRNGWTALHWACHGRRQESLEVVDLLLEREDIDLNPRNLDWETPLALACRNESDQSIPIIRSLLSHRNTDPNILNRNGDSILADFITYRHKMDNRHADEIESLLRKAGAR